MQETGTSYSNKVVLTTYKLGEQIHHQKLTNTKSIDACAKLFDWVLKVALSICWPTHCTPYNN